MSKIDEVKKILEEKRGVSGIEWTGNSYAMMYTYSAEDLAKQICQLFEPEHLGRARFKTAYADEVGEPDESLLLSDKEIREIAGHYHFFSNTMSLKKDYGEMIAKAQLAKDEARHEADKVKVREQTLKEVGEWLYQMPTVITSIDGRGRGVLVYQSEIESLKAGRMP